MSRRTGTKRVVPRFIYVESETTLGSHSLGWPTPREFPGREGWVFLRFLTPYLAVHEYLTFPHAVQPSAEIPLRISCFRLSTVDF